MRFKDNAWATDLTEMGSLSKNSGVKCFLYVIDVFTKYGWVKPLADQKTETVRNGFIRMIIKSKRKPSKLWLIKEENFTITLRKNG